MKSFIFQQYCLRIFTLTMLHEYVCEVISTITSAKSSRSFVILVKSWKLKSFSLRKYQKRCLELAMLTISNNMFEYLWRMFCLRLQKFSVEHHFNYLSLDCWLTFVLLCWFWLAPSPEWHHHSNIKFKYH